MIETNESELIDLWARLGIQSGMNIMVHSFLPSLGRIIPSCDAVVDSLVTTIGARAHLIVPTFTYSFFNGEVYDVLNSPSQVGVLGDIVRKRPEAVRSLSPNFSMAAIGPQASSLMKRDIPRDFGPGTIYDRLLQEDLYLLLLGVDFTSVSLFMHLEHVNKVSYRHEKVFSGIVREKDREYDTESYHFVRDATMNPESYRERIGAVIDGQESCRSVDFAYGTHRFVPANTIASLVEEKIQEDPFFLIKKPVHTEESTDAEFME